MASRLILASRSPRRRELLEGLDIPFRVEPPSVDEEPEEGENPKGFVMRVSEEKALSVAKREVQSWVLGADTVVVVEGKVFGKPKGPEDAIRMLRCLSGKVHRVFTAFCLLNLSEGRTFQGVEETEVKFIPMGDDEIRWYVSTGEPLGKAGAYAIQGKGGAFVEWIRGSYSNVVGLPLAQVLGPLREVGLWLPQR